MRASRIQCGAVLCGLLAPLLLPLPGYGQETVTTEPPSYQSASPPPSEAPCPKGKRGGAIAGIVVGSVFWYVLPMSIPVLITQTKKLKAHNRAQLERRCQYAYPR
ncbi:MAG TPA: hypothetical protein VFG22_02280 [Polyangiales bacterium]|nr:hypothetical protein [Polyangiales bacterium]